METCSRRKRPSVPATGAQYGVRVDDPCPGVDYISCRIATEAYRRGVRDCAEVMKQEADTEYVSGALHATIDWTDADEAVAGLIGGGE